MTLIVPVIPPDCDLITAAQLYTQGGFYVGPVAPGTKSPGSVLGDKWHHKTFRDLESIYGWFAGCPHGSGLFLHMGRSGGVAFDIDAPERIHPVLLESLRNDQPPFQETRPERPDRGHAVYEVPENILLGNSTGSLGDDWGEVRGNNGVIIVAPSPHVDGGNYRWVRTGPAPALRGSLLDALPVGKPGEDAASDAHLAALMTQWVGSLRPELMRHPLLAFDEAIKRGASRHNEATDAACWMAREARAGAYPLQRAFNALSVHFIGALTTPMGGRRIVNARQASHEFHGIMAWAVAQAEREDIESFSGRVLRPFNPLDPATGDPPKEFITDANEVRQPQSQTAMLAELAENPDDVDEEENPSVRHLVEIEKWKIRIREIARTELYSDVKPVEPFITGKDFLAMNDSPVQFRMEGLLPKGGKIILSAQRKAGKTHMVMNVIRHLIDGGPFLGRFETVPVTTNLTLIDLEMDPDQLRAWIRSQGIQSTERLNLRAMVGNAAAFNLMNKKARIVLADELVKAETEILVIDCLRPILDAVGLDESRETGRFLNMVDDLMQRAAISELILVHHAGHFGERSRGDSRLRDWPTAEWRIMRDTTGCREGEEPGPHALRFFAAEGRDVAVPESLIHFDPATGRMTLEEERSRAVVKTEATMNKHVLDFVKGFKEPFESSLVVDGWIKSKNNVFRATGVNKNGTTSKALDEAISRRLIVFEDGRGYRLGGSAGSEPVQEP